ADAVPIERPLEKGDLLRFDVGCNYYGFKSDVARTVVIGEPNALQQKRYNAILAGQLYLLDHAKPNISAGTLFAQAIQQVEENGLTPFRRHHVGHAIGLSGYEHPVITPNNDAQLEADNIFCFEVPFYEPG